MLDFGLQLGDFLGGILGRLALCALPGMMMMVMMRRWLRRVLGRLGLLLLPTESEHTFDALNGALRASDQSLDALSGSTQQSLDARSTAECGERVSHGGVAEHSKHSRHLREIHIEV
jgi:hypothetical protein